MDLVNQLAELSPGIAAAAQSLQQLMSPRCTFTWTIDHDAAFRQVKRHWLIYHNWQCLTLTCPPFSRQMPHVSMALATPLCKITAELHLHLVQCGSCFPTDAETRYTMIELEMLTTVWAMQKCSFYLRGLHHFEHITDHRPLIPILDH